MNFNWARSAKALFAVATLGALSACGGGPADNSSSGPPVINTPDWFLDNEYTNGYALALINAQVLLTDQEFASSQDVVVAVIDSGIDLDHPEFGTAGGSNDRIDRTNSKDIETVETDDDGDGTSVDDIDGHGTWVSGVIAANFDGDTTGNGIHGVAFESTILALDALDDDGSVFAGYYDADLVAALNEIGRLKDAGENILVVNMSLGGGGNSPALNAAMKAITDRGIAIVISAGNFRYTDVNGCAQPDDCRPDIANPAAQAGDTDYNGLIVSVAATGSRIQDGTSGAGFDEIDPTTGLPYISDFSHLCNSTDNRYCIAAPGTDIRTTDIGGGYTNVDGTSFSAPIVAGAIALLIEASGGAITPAQAVQIILETALDPSAGATLSTSSDFNTSNDDYGNGFLYLTGALAPQGAVVTRTGSGMQQITGANLTPAAAFGDAFTKASAFQNSVMFDSYDRPYVIDVTDFVSMVEQSANISVFTDLVATTEVDSFENEKVAVATMREVRDPLAHPGFAAEEGKTLGIVISYQVDRKTNVSVSSGTFTGNNATFGFAARATDSYHMTDSAASPFGYMTQGGDRIALERRKGDWTYELGYTTANQDFGNVASFHYKAVRGFDSGLNFGAQVEAIFEDQSFLGSSTEGVFDSGYQAGTLAATFGLGYSKGPLEVFAQFTQSMTKTESDGTGLLSDFSDIRAQAAVLGLSYDGLWSENDRFTLSYSEPLRVTDGDAAYDGQLTDDFVASNGDRVSLRPSGHQRNIEISYRRNVSRLTNWGVGLAYILDPNHSATAENELAFGFKLQHQF